MWRVTNQSKFRRDEKGIVLIYVIFVLMLALLVIPPILQFGFGSIRTAQIREERMLKVYAADTGIEDAYMNILARLKGESPSINYDYEISGINGYDVHVQIVPKGGRTYKVFSTAYGGEGASITIESNTGTTNYGGLFDNVLTSQQDIRIRPGSYVYGNVTYNGVLTGGNLITGNITRGLEAWPVGDELYDHYWPQVSAYPYPYGYPLTIPGNATIELGPCYTSGSLIIQGTNTGQYGNLTLRNNHPSGSGTLFVQGDLTVGGIGGKYLNLRLNGQTIYVTGNAVFYQEVQLFGPGCIIVEGDVDFQPHPDGYEFIFVMAVNGEIKVRPSGSFMGSFAGKMRIDLQPGTELRWTQYPIEEESGEPGLNFPGGLGTAIRVMDYIIRD